MKIEERIDVPCVNITGGYADISNAGGLCGREINIGDTVTVIDCGNEIRERVIRLEYYPYQSDEYRYICRQGKKGFVFLS